MTISGDLNILRAIRKALLCKTGLWHNEYYNRKGQKWCSVCHSQLNKPKDHILSKFPFKTS